MYYRKLADALQCTDDEIIAVYTNLHKVTEESRQLNCGSCGFATCEQMVAAIILGTRTIEHCVYYTATRNTDTQPAGGGEKLENLYNLLKEAEKSLDDEMQLVNAMVEAAREHIVFLLQQIEAMR